MQLVDHIFILLIFVVQPIYGAIESRNYQARIAAGQPAKQVRFYVETAIMEWVFLAALAFAWWFYGRSIIDLGFRNPEFPQFWVGSAVLGVVIGLLIYSWHSVKQSSNDEKSKQIEKLGPIVHFVPQTNRDLRYFCGVSITAGIVEEIVYRGFVIWYLGLFMPLWLAVIVSSVGFALGHSYQGVAGVLRVGLIGLAFAIYYVLTGSIWLPILAHIALDILQGPMLVELFRRDDEGGAELVSG